MHSGRPHALTTRMSDGYAVRAPPFPAQDDGGYQGAAFQAGLKTAIASVNVEIVRRCDRAKGFVVLPRRWIVERTFAWLGRCRRLAKDWECLNAKALAFLKLASIRLMTRRLCNPS